METNSQNMRGKLKPESVKSIKSNKNDELRNKISKIFESSNLFQNYESRDQFLWTELDVIKTDLYSIITNINSTNDELSALNIKTNKDKCNKEEKKKKDPKHIENLSCTKTKVREIQIPKQASQNNFPLSTISVSKTPISLSSNIGKRFERSPTKIEVNKKLLKSIDSPKNNLKKEKNLIIKEFYTKDNVVQKVLASKSPSNLKVIKRIELEAIKDGTKSSTSKIKPRRDVSPQVVKKVVNMMSDRKVNSAKASKSPIKTTTSINSVEINIDNQLEKKISHIQIDITQDTVDLITVN